MKRPVCLRASLLILRFKIECNSGVVHQQNANFFCRAAKMPVAPLIHIPHSMFPHCLSAAVLRGRAMMFLSSSISISRPSGLLLSIRGRTTNRRLAHESANRFNARIDLCGCKLLGKITACHSFWVLPGIQMICEANISIKGTVSQPTWGGTLRDK